MKKWQHLVVFVNLITVEGVTNFLDGKGKEGWELVSFHRSTIVSDMGYLAVFKREIPEVQLKSVHASPTALTVDEEGGTRPGGK